MIAEIVIILLVFVILVIVTVIPAYENQKMCQSIFSDYKTNATAYINELHCISYPEVYKK